MMFLIEYAKGCFIDGEDIQWVKLEQDKVCFILKSDCEHQLQVDKKYQSIFVNNLQAINQNIASIESAYFNAQQSI